MRTSRINSSRVLENHAIGKAQHDREREGSVRLFLHTNLDAFEGKQDAILRAQSRNAISVRDLHKETVRGGLLSDLELDAANAAARRPNHEDLAFDVSVIVSVIEMAELFEGAFKREMKLTGVDILEEG